MINYHNGKKLYEVGEVDNRLSETSEQLLADGKQYTDDRIADFSLTEIPIGGTVYWAQSECIERTVHSDSPFAFTVHGKEYSVAVPDAVVKMNVARNVPNNWKALDGTAELNASEYPELAEFFDGMNTTTEGKIWLPYVAQRIIKVAA